MFKGLKLFSCSFFTFFFLIPNSFSAENSFNLNKTSLKKLEEVFTIIKNDYVYKVSEGELIDNAINGMLASLDPHSRYLNEAEYKEMQLYTTGELGGLGLELTVDNGMIKVVSTINGSPAYKAGIKQGDYIIAVDGKSFYGLAPNEAIQTIRGKPGTPIKLTIVRDDISAPIELNLKRELVKIKSVSHSYIHNKYLYLKIASFADNTTEQVIEILKKYKNLNVNNKGIILDVRNNDGGVLNRVTEIANIFLEKGIIVSTRGRGEIDMESLVTSDGIKVLDIPIVMLVNSASASAAEILAGALKDHNRAVLIGTRTFGKGTVQELLTLKNNNEGVSLTTAFYYTPSGKSIQAEGIEPDIVIEDLEVYSKKKANLHPREENLYRHINSQESKKLDFRKLKQSLKGNKNSFEIDLDKDYQLLRATDLLKGIITYNEKRT